MAPPRTYWTGHLRLSLVSIEVGLYSATESSGRTSLRQIHRGSGQPIRYTKTAEGVGPVDADEIVKGFETARNQFVILEPEELDAIKLESKETIRIVQFVDQGDIDPRYYEKPYYVAPRSDTATEGFVVIREALRRSRKVALGQMATRGRESLVAIRPCSKGLLLETLRYADEVRSSDSVFADIPEAEIDPEMLELADDLIAKKSGPFDPSAFRDSYEAALRELIAQKARGKAVVPAGGGRPRGGQVIDLMEALKKSVGEERASRGEGSGKGSGKGKGQGKAAGARKKTASKDSGPKSAPKKAAPRKSNPAKKAG